MNHYESLENRKKHKVSFFFRKEIGESNDVQAKQILKKGGIKKK